MFNKTIPRVGGGSKKCKPIPAPPRGAGLKSHPIPAPPPLRGGENLHDNNSILISLLVCLLFSIHLLTATAILT